MRPRRLSFPVWLAPLGLIFALGIVITLLVLLRAPDQTIFDPAAPNATATPSGLLPGGWLTWTEDWWTMGYAPTWNVTEDETGLRFSPSSSEEPGIIVTEDERELETIRALYEQSQDVIVADFLFVGYAAVKFTLPSGVQEYFVLGPENRILHISVLTPDVAETGIMLATFKFIIL